LRATQRSAVRVSDSIISSCAATFRPLTGAHAAAAQLPDWCVVDGELVALDEAGRLSFDLLQRRLVTSSARARRPVAEHPASFMAFDLLAAAGVDIRQQRWATRRSRLESLAGWMPPCS
jgi:ATP-dependent DNA ligase